MKECKLLFLGFYLLISVGCPSILEDLPLTSEINFEYILQRNGSETIKIKQTETQWKIVNCDNCRSYCNYTLECDEGDGLVIGLKMQRFGYLIHFNVTCTKESHFINTIHGLKQKRGLDNIIIYWKMVHYDIDYDICIRAMNESSFKCLFVTTRVNSYKFRNLEEKRKYDICIAIVNRTDQIWRRSGYKCWEIWTEVKATGPIVNLNYFVFSYSIYITWNKPDFKYDNPEGYIVKYSNKNSKCKLIWIKLKDTNINLSSCEIIQRIYSNSETQNLTITDLTPFSEYKVEVFPVNGEKEYIPIIINIITLEGKSRWVDNIREDVGNGTLVVSFDPPTHPFGIILYYIIEIYLKEINMCSKTWQMRLRYHNKSYETYHSINTQSWRCGLYLIKITPVNSYPYDMGLGHTESINYKHKNGISILKDAMEIEIVSRKIIKISLNSLLVLDCGNLGFVTEIMVGNEYPCTVVVISSNWCSKFNRTIKESFKCRNKIFLTYTNKNITMFQVIGGRQENTLNIKMKLWEVYSKKSFTKLIKKSNNMNNEDCFTDFYQYRYNINPLMTENNVICLSRTNSNKHGWNRMSSYCSCLSENGEMNECDRLICYGITIIQECNVDVSCKITSAIAEISWNSRNCDRRITGSIIMLYNSLNVCEEVHFQLFPTSNYTSFGNRIDNFYKSCKLKININEESNGSTFKVSFKNRPYTAYFITVLSNFEIGKIQRISLNKLLTEPSMPTYIKITLQSQQTLSFTWKNNVNSLIYGKADHFIANLTNMETMTVISKNVSEEKVSFFNLDKCVKYCFSIFAQNIAGFSKTNSKTCWKTLPEHPKTVLIESIRSNENNINVVTWRYNGISRCVDHYKVEYWITFVNQVYLSRTKEIYILFQNLEKNVFYSFRVKAVAKDNHGKEVEGEYSSEKRFFNGKNQSSVQNLVFEHKDKVVNISWSKSEKDFGFIFRVRNYLKKCLEYIELICEDCRDPHRKKNLGESILVELNNISFCERKINYTFSYQISNFFQKININKRTSYLFIEMFSISLVGINRIFERNITYYEPKTYANLVYATSVIVLALLITIATLMKLKMKKNILGKFHHFKFNQAKCSKDHNAKYAEEFQNLEEDSTNIESEKKLTKSVGKMLVNIKKNKYSDIIPFDQTRVILRSKQSPNDYINASYIPFVDNAKTCEYIAAQDPMMHNIWDFWEMIWQENVSIIVMLSNSYLENNEKCIQYWPEDVNRKFSFGYLNEVVVRMNSEIVNDIFIEREMQVEHKKEIKCKKIIQLQMLGWVANTDPKMEHMEKLVSRFQALKKSPIDPPYLIHCSNGVSQSGVFISIDRLINSCEVYLPIHVYGTVLMLREHRPFMVQNQELYSFIHKYIIRQKDSIAT